MAQEIINVGNIPNDSAGDPIRLAFQKTNNNFTELYNIGGLTGIQSGNSNIQIDNSSTVRVSSTGVANVFVVSGTGATVQGQLAANGLVTVTGNVETSGFYIGNGSQLSGVVSSAPASLITGNTLSSNVVNSSLTSVGALNNLIVSNALGGTGNIFANNITIAASADVGGNIIGGNIISLGVANVVTLNAILDISSENITANNNIGASNIAASNLLSGTTLSVSGNVTGGNIVTAGAISTSANVLAQNFIGTVATSTQNLITAVGVLNSLQVSGSASAGNISTVGTLSAQGNTVVGNLATGGSIQAQTISASNSITGGNILSNGIVSAAGDVIGTNITLSGSAAIGGNVSGSNLTLSGSAIIGGNLVVNGNTVYTNIEDLAVQDPIISIGRGPNYTPLLSNDGKDRGTAAYYFDTAERIGFFGYQNSTGKLIAARAVSVNNEIVTVSQFGTIQVGTLESTAVSATGNVTAGNVTSSGILSAAGNITGSNITISTSGSVPTLTVSTLANITSSTAATSTTTGALRVAGGAGIGGNIVVGGNVSGSNITSTNNISAASLAVTGNTATVTSADYAIGYRDIPQITSFGTLTSTDGGKHYFGSGTITIPTNAVLPLAVGTTILVVASSTTTIAAAAGVTLRLAGTTNTGSRTLATNGMATIIKVAANIWYINGTGLT